MLFLVPALFAFGVQYSELDPVNFRACQSGPNMPVLVSWCGNKYDLDRDGDVDMDDFGFLQRRVDFLEDAAYIPCGGVRLTGALWVKADSFEAFWLDLAQRLDTLPYDTTDVCTQYNSPRGQITIVGRGISPFQAILLRSLLVDYEEGLFH